MSNRPVLVALGVFLSGAPALADGPFGVTMGSDIDSYKDCKPTKQTGYFECSALPRSHPDMQKYIIQAMPGIGVCFIRALTGEIETGAHGIELRQRTDDLMEQIAKTYGASKKTDLLMPGSIWKESNHWVMAVLKKDRIYGYDWSPKTKAKLKDGLTAIRVAAVATGPTSGRVEVEFHSEKTKRCRQAEQEAKARAF